MGFFELQIQWYGLTLKTVAARLTEERKIEIDSEKVGLAIAEIHGYTQNLQIFWYVLENGLNIYNELRDFSFGQILGEIELVGDDCVYPKGIPAELYEKQIKVKGQKWELHKNDADPFPSNPHAHNYETGLKLDLSNGGLYKKKKLVDSVNGKTLVLIREKFEAAEFTMPALTI